MDLASLHQQQQQQQKQQFITGNNLFVTQMSENIGGGGGHYKQMSQPQLITIHQQQQQQVQQQQQQPPQPFHKPSRSVVHVRENSLDELDALFDPSKWSMRKTNNLPLTKRNLPQSFFKPPETGGTKTPKLIGSSTHSRQNSIDQTNMLNHSNLLNQQHLLLQQKLNNLNGSPLNNNSSNNNNNTGLSVLQNHLSSNFHTRSISEPVAAPALSPFNANNQTQFNLNQQQHHFQQQQQQQQQNQLAKNQQQHIQNNMLPYGWRTAKTQQGQRYFINYITKQTSWTIPTQVAGSGGSGGPNSYYDQQQQNNQIENFISSSSSTSSSPVLNLTNMSNNNHNPSDLTADLSNPLHQNHHHLLHGGHHGSINTHLLNIDVKNDCMLNSNNNSNSMGLSSTLSSSTSASVSASDDDLIAAAGAEFQQQQQQQQYHFELQQQLEKLESQQQLEFILNQIQMPNGWEKAQTAKGEVYFINHNNKSTYWEDPRLALIPNFLKQQKLKLTSNTNRISQQHEQTNIINQNNNINTLSPFNINANGLMSSNGSNLASSLNSNLLNNDVNQIELTSNTNETGFEQNVQATNQIDIKSMIVEVINKKKELFKSLEDLNKQESFLRAQLNAAFSNCNAAAAATTGTNEFNINFEENFECMETSNKTVENNITNSFSNNITNELSVNDKLNPIQSNKSVSSSSSPSSIMSNSSNNSNNMSFYQNALKSNNLENFNNLFQPNNNHLNTNNNSSETCLSNNEQIKISRKNQNGENLLSIIKTESVNPQIADQLDAVSSLYNKLLINNGQNNQFQIEQNTLINNSSMQNKIIDFI